jgi:hypothetical protein
MSWSIPTIWGSFGPSRNPFWNWIELCDALVRTAGPHGGTRISASGFGAGESSGAAGKHHRPFGGAHFPDLPSRRQPRTAVHPAPLVPPPRREAAVGGQGGADNLLHLGEAHRERIDIVRLGGEVRRQPNVLKRSPLPGNHSEAKPRKPRALRPGGTPICPFLNQ